MISFPLQMMLPLRGGESNAAVIRVTCPLISSANSESNTISNNCCDDAGALPDPCFLKSPPFILPRALLSLPHSHHRPRAAPTRRGDDSKLCLSLPLALPSPGRSRSPLCSSLSCRSPKIVIPPHRKDCSKCCLEICEPNPIRT